MKPIGLLILPCLSLLGCGATLDVSEQDRDQEPSGVVVNQRGVYDVSVKVCPDFQWGTVMDPGVLYGVRHTRVLHLNLTRMPFASASLKLVVDERGLLDDVGLKTEPGLAGAVDSATAVAAAFKELSKEKDEE